MKGMREGYHEEISEREGASNERVGGSEGNIL